MLSLIRSWLTKKKHDYYTVEFIPNLNDSYRFLVPDDSFIKELSCCISQLKNNPCAVVEVHLRGKEVSTFSSEEQLLSAISNDVKENYNDYSKEFEEGDFAFEYYLAHSQMCSNSVELIQRVFHKSGVTGDLYYSLVIKFNNGEYFYWRW